MMHNSIWIRDLLKETNRDPLHARRRDPHLGIRFDDPVLCGKGEFMLDGEWKIIGGEEPGIKELSADLEDFMGRIGVLVSKNGSNRIRLVLEGGYQYGEFSLSTSPSEIEITSSDLHGLWSGAAYLEREMSSRRGPVLPVLELNVKPSWGVQISQAPWGSNYLVPDLSPDYLSDDAFRLLAHYGVNGMTIYGDILFYVKSEVLPELNHPDREENLATLRDATERSSSYGISLYWVPVLPKLAEDHPVFSNYPGVRGSRLGTPPGKKRIFTLCSSEERSLEFYSEFWESIFTEVPLLGGLIMIIGGESYYHCYMRPAGEDLDDERGTNCPRCSERKAEEIVSRFAGNTSSAVHRVKPDAPVLAWPYSAFRWSADFNQLALIESLPGDVGLLSEIDKDHFMKKEGYTKRIWDYSVDFTGPSDRIKAQERACRSRGLGFFVKSETAIGLEAIHMPYVPCLQRLGEKWSNVSGLGPDGVLQSWMFFGMWGSRAEELGWWRRWRPEKTLEEALNTMASRDFGSAWGSVVEAWKATSQAVSHLPCIPPYFNGPWFLGPAHPLLFGNEVPQEFMGALYFLQENEVSLSRARLDALSSLVLEEVPDSPRNWWFLNESGGNDWDAFIAELGLAVNNSQRAFNIISDALKMDLSSGDASRLKEEALHIEFFHRTMLSIKNTLGFLLAEPGEGRMVHAGRELENAEAAWHLYEEAPWLDLSLRRDAGFPPSMEMLKSKINILKEHLDGPIT